jgi:hypothetical protein
MVGGRGRVDGPRQGQLEHRPGSRLVERAHRSVEDAEQVSNGARMGVEVDDARAAGVAMVEPDHLQATLYESRNQRIGTGDALRPADPMISRTAGYRAP